MKLIDENGNLLGVVNVIDALAVVLLLAVIIAGFVVVMSGGDDPGAEPSGEPATRYATIDLGKQPDYVADRIEEGDVAVAGGSTGNVTVTDVHITPTLSGPSILIRAEINGELRETGGRQAFRVGDEPLRLGSDLRLDMDAYATNGTVTDLGTDNSTLPIEETATTVDVELRNVSTAVVDGLEEGLSETVRGETIATIESIESEPAAVVLESDDGQIYEREHPRNEDVTLTVELRTTETEAGVYFRGTPLKVGTMLDLNFETMTVEGEVVRIE
ncbi:DUF4330 family protein [Halosolutus gelatinilyticus]|uniref:DUF4330 family protein n=1 Tax=Halosolutus gelatinilyticus TaxID=2931975 RepID=UPI001FF16B0F|nr:DUF4330 family protein [Halosolutus gelatinilyticus]